MLTDDNFRPTYELSLAQKSAQATDLLEKGKAAEIGTVRTWSGQQYVKHFDGWVHVHPVTGKVTVLPTSGPIRHFDGTDEHKAHFLKHTQDLPNTSITSKVAEPVKAQGAQEPPSTTITPKPTQPVASAPTQPVASASVQPSPKQNVVPDRLKPKPGQPVATVPAQPVASVPAQPTKPTASVPVQPSPKQNVVPDRLKPKPVQPTPSEDQDNDRQKTVYTNPNTSSSLSGAAKKALAAPKPELQVNPSSAKENLAEAYQNKTRPNTSNFRGSIRYQSAGAGITSIGSTSSNKPVFLNKPGYMYSTFSHQDHEDARALHLAIADKAKEDLTQPQTDENKLNLNYRVELHQGLASTHEPLTNNPKYNKAKEDDNRQSTLATPAGIPVDHPDPSKDDAYYDKNKPKLNQHYGNGYLQLLAKQKAESRLAKGLNLEGDGLDNYQDASPYKDTDTIGYNFLSPTSVSNNYSNKFLAGEGFKNRPTDLTRQDHLDLVRAYQVMIFDLKQLQQTSQVVALTHNSVIQANKHVLWANHPDLT